MVRRGCVAGRLRATRPVHTDAAGRRGGLSPQMDDLVVEEADDVLAYLFASSRRIVALGTTAARPGVRQRVAKIGERARRMRPTLARDQVSHVAPRVEWLGETTEHDRRTVPTELLHVGAHPELERLCGDGLDVVDHRSPARVARQDVATDVRDRTDADGQDDEIEVLADAQDLSAHFAAVPV